MTTRLSRAGACLAATGLLIGMLAACASEQDPVKTPRPLPTKTAIFESDEEAFAAAEKTYRAYNEADNRQRRGDESADPDQYLTGIALEQTTQDRDEYEQRGMQLEGDLLVAAFIPDSAGMTPEGGRLTATICLDISHSRVLDRDGKTIPMPERPRIVAQFAEMTWEDEGFKVSKESSGNKELCAGL